MSAQCFYPLLVTVFQEHEEMARTDVLEERVTNHIKFFWVVVGFGFLWLSAVTALLLQTKSAVEGIRPQLAQSSIATYAMLPATDLQTALPEIDRSISLIKEKRLPVPVSAIGAIQNKLATVDSTTPGYWSTAESLINYHSELTPGVPERSIVLPKCKPPADLDASPNARWFPSNPQGEELGPGAKIDRVGVQDCWVQLDGQKASRWDCTHCVILYAGGPVSLHDVHFINCLFVLNFPSRAPPSPSGQQFSKELLASDLQKVTIWSVSAATPS
jgi:hypothetical protein